MIGTTSVFDSQEFPLPVSAPSVRSVTCAVDRDRRLVSVTLAGDVTVDALYAARDAVLADVAYVPGMNVWVECRVVSAIPTDGEIRAMALGAVRAFTGSALGRVAIIAMTARSFEAASLFELFADAPTDRLAVFTDPLQARAWLSLP